VLISFSSTTTPANKAKENINVSSSSYLQNLFPSTIMQLNTYTPSALSTNTQNIDKRTPATTKATPSLSFFIYISK